MCHSSWVNVYRKFNDFLINNFKNNGAKPHCYVKLTNKRVGTLVNRYLNFGIYDNYLLKTLKREAIRMNLPFMTRKWNKVNLKYITERENTPIIISTIKKLIDKGMNKKEIIKKTKYTESRVKWTMKKLNVLMENI
jgi:hypothetical protein